MGNKNISFREWENEARSQVFKWGGAKSVKVELTNMTYGTVHAHNNSNRYGYAESLAYGVPHPNEVSLTLATVRQRIFLRVQ